MARAVGIGYQDFEQMTSNDNFYIDKTMLIKEWWENNDAVTLITRPRRFGKTLNLDMIEHFFSVKYAGRSDLFQNLSIWQEKTCRNTAQEALARIERMKYAASLETKGIPQERI